MKLNSFFKNNNWARVFWLYIIAGIIIFCVIDVDKALYQTRLATLNRLRPPTFDYIVKFDQDKNVFDQEKIEQFQHYYKKVSQFVPDRADAYGLLGYSLFYLNKDKEAIKAYQKSIALNSEFFFYYYNLAVIYHDQKDYQQSLAMIQKAMKINPRNTIDYIKKSVRLYVPLIVIKEKVQKKSVEKDLKNAYHEIQTLLILNYYHLEEFGSMQKAAAKSRLSNPNDQGMFTFYEGVAAYHQKDYPRALQQLKTATEKDSRNATAWTFLGKTLDDTGNTNYATQAYQQAKRIQSSNNTINLLEYLPELVLY